MSRSHRPARIGPCPGCGWTIKGCSPGACMHERHGPPSDAQFEPPGIDRRHMVMGEGPPADWGVALGGLPKRDRRIIALVALAITLGSGVAGYLVGCAL